MRKPILCVDFDGVIHAYTSPWIDAVTISDGPVPGALQWLWKATEWFDVQVYSSRSKDAAARGAMAAWFLMHARETFPDGHPMRSAVGPYPITYAHEKPAAFLTIDDRALTFDGDWNAINPHDLLSFKPWNKRPEQKSKPSMTSQRETSMPFAAIARDFGEDYGEVVRYAEHCGNINAEMPDDALSLQAATRATIREAVKREAERRRDVQDRG